MKKFKVIEFQRHDKTHNYTITKKVFNNFKEFIEYTEIIQKKCKENDIHANYYVDKPEKLEKILYISNEGLYCTL